MAGEFPIDRRSSQALVIHCSDPRFQESFRRFVQEELGIGKYVLLAVGGGGYALGEEGSESVHGESLWEQVRFFITAAGLPEVVIINHDDCLWYRHSHSHGSSADIVSRQAADLLWASQRISRDFAGVRVRLFMAKIEGNRVQFVQVG